MSCKLTGLVFGLLLSAVVQAQTEGSSALVIESSSFKNAEMIPAKYTCDGENISPQLSWANVPRHTISFVIICDDPDAPGSEWSHWVLFNVPASVNELPEGASKKNLLPPGSIVGRNDFKKTGYGGPCPPSGLHRYFFKLYALDCKLKLNTGATKQEVLLAIRKHVLGMAFIMGKYRRVK